MAMAPPVVVNDAVEPLGKIMLRALPGPAATFIEEAEMDEPAPRLRVGLISWMALPPPTVVVVAALATIEPPAVAAENVTVPAAPASRVSELPNVRALAPPTDSVTEAAPPPVSVTEPVPAVLRAPVLWTVTEPAALDEVRVPLSVKVPPFTLATILLFDATVVLALIVVLPAPEVVIVTAPPLRFSVVEPAPADLVNNRF